MSQLQFASIFTERRKQLQLTQEDVARFVGVSRAAVSKWEKGQSYPDISLLPKLAMYFDLSIDTLLGYEPQLTTQRIAELYSEIAKRFANEPFEQVEQAIVQLTDEYYSCYSFLSKMAQLNLNYLPQSPHPTETAQHIFTICERIKHNSDDLHLLKEATALEATTYLMLQQPQQVIDRLGDEPNVDFNNDLLITSALTMLGETQQAKQVIQVSAYQNILAVISLLTESMMLEQNKAYIDETVNRVQSLIDLFNIRQLNVNSALVFYVKAAHSFATQQNTIKASEMVEQYLKAILSIKFPLQLDGDDYFYLLHDWLDSQQHVMQQAPRDEQSIKHDLLATVDQHPLLSPLLEQPNVAVLYKNVKHYLKEA